MDPRKFKSVDTSSAAGVGKPWELVSALGDGSGRRGLAGLEVALATARAAFDRSRPCPLECGLVLQAVPMISSSAARDMAAALVFTAESLPSGCRWHKPPRKCSSAPIGDHTRGCTHRPSRG